MTEFRYNFDLEFQHSTLGVNVNDAGTSSLISIVFARFIKGDKGDKGEKGDTPVLTADEDGVIYADGEELTDVVKTSSEMAKEAAEEAGKKRFVTLAQYEYLEAHGELEANCEYNIYGDIGTPPQGRPGRGIEKIEHTSTSGKVKTYTITYTDTTTSTFEVTDGNDGQQGQPGQGVVAGGTTGQVLKKKSATDYDTEWGTMTIPTKTSELTNDSGFLTQHQDISGKQDKIDAEHKLSYSLISGTPTIPTKTSDLTNDSGFLTQHQSLSAYRRSADQDTIDATKVNEPTTEGTSGQVLTTDGNGGRTWTTVQGGGGEPAAYLKDAAVTNEKLTLTKKDNTTVELDISDKADTSDIPTKTSDLTNDSGFLTEHQDISGKLNKPAQEGSNGQVLTTDGQGGTSWTTPATGTDLTLVHKTLTASSNALTFAPTDAREYDVVSISANLALTLNIGNANEHYLLVTNTSASAVTIAVTGASSATIIGSTAISVPASKKCEMSFIKDNGNYVVTYFVFE